MRKLVVRKGLETAPKIWGLFIPFFLLVIVITGGIVIFGALMMFFSLQGGTGAWKYALIIWGIGLPAMFVVTQVLKSKSVSDKTNFAKRVTTVSNADILNILK